MFIAEAKIQIPSKRPQNVLCIYYGGPIVNFQNDNGTVSAYQTDKVPEHLQALSEHVISEYQAYTNRQQELAEEERLEKVEFIEKAAKLDYMSQRLQSYLKTRSAGERLIILEAMKAVGAI